MTRHQIFAEVRSVVVVVVVVGVGVGVVSGGGLLVCAAAAVAVAFFVGRNVLFCHRGRAPRADAEEAHHFPELDAAAVVELAARAERQSRVAHVGPIAGILVCQHKSLVRARLNLRVVPRQARLRQRHVVRIQAPDRRSSFVERKLLAVLQLALSIDDRQVREHLRSAAGFVAPDVQVVGVDYYLCLVHFHVFAAVLVVVVSTSVSVVVIHELLVVVVIDFVPRAEMLHGFLDRVQEGRLRRCRRARRYLPLARVHATHELLQLHVQWRTCVVFFAFGVLFFLLLFFGFLLVIGPYSSGHIDIFSSMLLLIFSSSR